MVLAKGIRVNQLAKELGVTSKEILEKCRAEGLGDKDRAQFERSLAEGTPEASSKLDGSAQLR